MTEITSDKLRRKRALIAALCVGVLYLLAMMPIVVSDYDGSAPTPEE